MPYRVKTQEIVGNVAACTLISEQFDTELSAGKESYEMSEGHFPLYDHVTGLRIAIQRRNIFRRWITLHAFTNTELY